MRGLESLPVGDAVSPASASLGGTGRGRRAIVSSCVPL